MGGARGGDPGDRDLRHGRRGHERIGSRENLEGFLASKGATKEKLTAAIVAALEAHLDRLAEEGGILRRTADDVLDRLSNGEWIGKLSRLLKRKGR